ncbi:tripartite ATP-independent transporter solute receptor, DctP family [Devosia lucknowensis]|uniref:Tripartite ATP-independent transporter solute receptor, DctP family n=1 Tax=Devosia lucknowensis TaxID=1096929 RepID=A0A1Y6G8W6_9HYPH|nr:TRAP transporter substrate-binding protein [Devosia lucknowensis]SMQ86194.1 tripartite ATP-independent transporter solute receptor, DctP family [Devosia lucknowensis]
MTSVTRRLACAFMLGGALLASSMTAATAQDQRELKFAMSLAGDHPLGLAGQEFADLVAEKSGGSLTVSLYPNAVLGSDQQNLSAVRGGTLDFTIMATGLLAGIDPRFQVFDLPFMFNNSEEAYALSDGPTGSDLMAGLADDGIHGLGIWDLGFRNMTNNRRPIAALEDFQGLKLRVIASPIYIELFTQLGANPVPMTFGEVYGALEAGAIDGQDNPLAVIQSAKFEEVQDYLSLTRHIYTGMPFLMSQETWGELTPEHQSVISEAAEEAKLFGRNLVQEQEVSAIEQLGQEMEVNEPTAEEIARLREAVKPVVDKFAADVGADVMAAATSELEALR